MTQSEILELEKVCVGSIIQKDFLIDSHFLERHITSYHFTDTRNGILYGACISMHSENIKIDQISLFQWLAKNNLVEQSGGIAYIAELEGDSFPSNIDFYISQLTGETMRREAVRLLKSSAEKLLSLNSVTAEDIDRIAAEIGEVGQISQTMKIYNAAELHGIEKESVDNAIANKASEGIKSGFSILDGANNGFQKGEMSIIAARPSIGKTSLALSMAMNIARHTPCAFISLETPATMIAHKITGLVTDTAIHQLRNGFINTDRYEDIFGAKKKADFDGLKFYLVDKTRVEINELKSIIRKLVVSFGVQIVFIDYIGLVDAGDSKMPVFEKQAIVSRTLKETARELSIAVCALCQVSRANEKSNLPPSLADLRGSGSIEQDADVVMFIHGERIIPRGEPTARRSLLIAKNRNGECTAGQVLFTKSTAKYSDVPDDKEIPQ